MLRTALRIPRAACAARAIPSLGQRSLHSVPKLEHDFSEGVPGLFSADGFDMAWTQTMDYNLSKLNQLVAGTDLENRETKQIVHATARDPDQAPIFNHASLAHNTHFFFKTLSPTTIEMPPVLAQDLTPSFSSIKTLRQELVITAASMFGPGFVWLVKVANPALSTRSTIGAIGGSSPLSSGASPYAPYASSEYKILTTYLAGTPYPGAHWRLQPTDMNTVGAKDSAAPFLRGNQAAAQPGAGARSPGSLEAVPILCLSTWEHAWLRDYGVGGKRAFAEAWWDAIDWHAVAELASIRTRSAAPAPAPAAATPSVTATATA